MILGRVEAARVELEKLLELSAKATFTTSATQEEARALRERYAKVREDALRIEEIAQRLVRGAVGHLVSWAIRAEDEALRIGT